MKSRYKCGTGRAAALAALGASGALIAQGLTSTAPVAPTLNLRAGNYQLISTADLQLPPQAAAAMSPEALQRLKQPRIQSVCITDKELAKAQQQLSGQASDRNCQVTQQSTSGNQMDFSMRCAGKTVRFHGRFAANTYNATVLVTSDQGKTTTININARRIGDCTR